MANNKTYNGWTNYETWVVNLWMDNEEGTQRYWSERAEEIVRSSEADQYNTKIERAYSDLSDELKREHEENAPEVSGVFSGLLTAALGEVDWYEIAKSWIDNAVENMLANGETIEDESEDDKDA
jgi:hypothetical protein